MIKPIVKTKSVKLDRATTKEEKPINLGQFCTRMGISYPTGRAIWNDPTFPKIGGKLFWPDFVIWRRRPMESQHQPTSEDQQSGADHKASGLAPKNGLPVALPPRVERLLAEVASLS